jgi:hypothetical protein
MPSTMYLASCDVRCTSSPGYISAETTRTQTHKQTEEDMLPKAKHRIKHTCMYSTLSYIHTTYYTHKTYVHTYIQTYKRIYIVHNKHPYIHKFILPNHTSPRHAPIAAHERPR